MGKRGPAPTPTKVLERRGSWRAKTRKGEPQPEVGLPTMPTWLDPSAKRVWKRISPLLLAVGTISEENESCLAGYSQAYSDVMRLTRDVRKEGEVKSGVRNPKTTLLKEAYARLSHYEGQLGLTPASRTQVKTVAKPGKGDNEFW